MIIYFSFQGKCSGNMFVIGIFETKACYLNFHFVFIMSREDSLFLLFHCISNESSLMKFLSCLSKAKFALCY